MSKTLILGIGNFLLKDEGVGVHFAERLLVDGIPDNVIVEDGATGGIDLLYLMEGYEKAIIIDAMDFMATPGTVKKVSLNEIKNRKSHLSVSLHGISFFDIIEIAKELSLDLPEIKIIGIQPGDISQGVNLTPEIDAAYAEVKRLVFEEI